MSVSEKPYSVAWEWLLGGVCIAVPYVAWLQANGTWVSHYSVFALLGLWAWSLMWTHYMYGALSFVSSRFVRSKSYKQVSAYVVLAAILLHPGLLIYRLYQDTGVRPPDSYLNYVGEANKVFVLFGTVSMLTFLSYEVLKRVRKHNMVRRLWFWVSMSQAVAMTLIFVHALKLGSTLYDGWFQAYWVLLGCLLLPCFAVILRYDWQQRQR